ncbi:MAG: ribosomal protein S18-alanine N-acetyltransferase [Nocardioides sp.]
MIRAAEPRDVDAVETLERDGLGRDAWSRALIDEGVAGLLPTTSYVVADDAGTVVGYATVSVVPDVAELQRITVATSHRRRGVASDLLAEVVRRAAGTERLLLEVREDNAGALAFYADRGFGELARRPRYYRDGADAVVLQKELS